MTKSKTSWEIAHSFLVKIQKVTVIFGIYKQFDSSESSFCLILGTSGRSVTHVCQNRIRLVMMMPWRLLHSVVFVVFSFYYSLRLNAFIQHRGPKLKEKVNLSYFLNVGIMRGNGMVSLSCFIFIFLKELKLIMSDLTKQLSQICCSSMLKTLAFLSPSFILCPSPGLLPSSL